MYIPKSQIKDNLFTPGGEWYYVSSNSPYTGFYYQLSNGKAYTGKDQNDPPNEEIYQSIPLVSSETTTNSVEVSNKIVEYNQDWEGSKDLKIYGILSDTDYNLLKLIPQYYQEFPTPEDYKNGMFIRYFLCKINQLEYLEVNKQTYDNVDTKNNAWVWENYIPFTLDWYIKGDIDRVFNNNKGSIFIKEKEINKKGLGNYLGKKYLEYFKYPKSSNLTTTGGELITLSGQDYVGSYHIHENQGPMEGAIHIQGAHNRLFYKRFYQNELVDVLNQEGVIKTGESQQVEFVRDLTIEYDIPNQIQTSNNNSSTGGGY